MFLDLKRLGLVSAFFCMPLSFSPSLHIHIHACTYKRAFVSQETPKERGN